MQNSRVAAVDLVMRISAPPGFYGHPNDVIFVILFGEDADG